MWGRLCSRTSITHVFLIQVLILPSHESVALASARLCLHNDNSFMLFFFLFLLLCCPCPSVAMPEYGEVVAQVFVLTSFILWMSVTTGITGLTLRNIWVDSTKAEQLSANENPTPLNILQRLGLPSPLTPQSPICRGGSGSNNQPRVWPPIAASVDQLQNLVLIDVIWNPRNLILNFSSCCVQVS